MKLNETINRTKRPFLIAGPCSVETEEQIHTVIRDLSRNPEVSMIRAGIWKPRTRPGFFEGIGAAGLYWLEEARTSYKLPIAIEVATPKHIELALKHSIDAFWIGARTTANPFAMQDIADALRGVNVPVMVKNPVNPDIALWLGAFERLMNAGVEDLIAVHRGFSSHTPSKYRNSPNWELPIELRNQLPQIPMICDPSHITGNRQLLAEVSQKAMDLSFDGLMIETHPTPDKAWSDAAQQVTPDMLKVIMENLILHPAEHTHNMADELADLRFKLSSLDERLFELLSERMKINEKLEAFKRTNNADIAKEDYWEKTMEHSGLSKEFVHTILNYIRQESSRFESGRSNEHWMPAP